MKHEIDLLKEITGQLLSDKSVSDKKASITTPDNKVAQYYSLYPKWETESIKVGEIRSYEGINYYVAGDVTAIESQPPGSEGMTAIYRPIPPRDEDGNILFYLPGMNVQVGECCLAEGALYKAIQQMTPCSWAPGSAGTEAVWRKVTTGQKGDKG